MPDRGEDAAAFALLEAIAAALREELGAAIEEQPGGPDGDSAAGQVNRAFRVIARTIMRPTIATGEDEADLLNRLLDRLARRRLGAAGLDRRAVESLLRESGGRDDWLAFFALTRLEEVEEILRTRDPGRGPA